MKKKEQKNDMAGEGRRQGSDYQGRGDDPSEVLLLASYLPE